MSTDQEPVKHSTEWLKKQSPENLRREAKIFMKIFWRMTPVIVFSLVVFSGMNIYFNRDNAIIYFFYWLILGSAGLIFFVILIFAPANAYRFRKWADERESQLGGKVT